MSDHRDPFDRMLTAQPQTERLALVSNETLFDQFRCERLWQKDRGQGPA